MPTRIKQQINSGSTAFVNVVPKDEDGTAVTPSAASWYLVNEDGDVVNSRSNVTISSLSASIDIELEPTDTQYSDGSARVLRVDYTYDSDRGSGLSGKDWCFLGILQQYTS